MIKVFRAKSGNVCHYTLHTNEELRRIVCDATWDEPPTQADIEESDATVSLFIRAKQSISFREEDDAKREADIKAFLEGKEVH